MSKTLIKDSVPAFLAKLWKLLNDTETDNIIHWSKDGTTFVVKDQGKFSADILPKYFKHGNFASFVRQLNMYGFHKVFNAERGGLNGRDYWEFSNNNFQRDYPDKLDMVKRKVSKYNCSI
ncbi:uncharacterized protein TRIADDRAFT_23376 [Trichoplax adhaerens]|uniref:HSF-type DNA-binding domain-containing protein n=1 Tax=Trichoplax adhaerens TaxID=10228 RepID=B3RV30_TRIAD|nr:hypothetical protein TRIADDRAFT_23376 [Trichoplax adhaerens]EDV25925.1 hypothetical protein TRIADDRAFT_23376 [Trichoplax adhaerens]|eukprot:XP_002111958.1 hypothetical protein TRIADDRAFT_23376 [Trichoplax adhaerens]